MTEPGSTDSPSFVEDLAKTAIPTPQDSAPAERAGDQGTQDTGGLVPPDHAQDVQPPA